MVKNLGLAKQVKTVLDEATDPRSVTVQEIGAQLEVPVEHVIEVIDEHAVKDGKVAHVGAGQGGDWVPPEQKDEPAAA